MLANQSTAHVDFFDTCEVGKMLRLTPATIRKCLRDGTIKGVQCGARRWRIPMSEIERLRNPRVTATNM